MKSYLELDFFSHGKKALGYKWVYKIKRKSNGNIERYKVHLVTLGSTQVKSWDYHETFASIVMMIIIRTLLTIASSRNWDIYQKVVHNAFLYGDLSKKVYVKLLPRFANGREEQVFRLKKSLYGLNQAS